MAPGNGSSFAGGFGAGGFDGPSGVPPRRAPIRPRIESMVNPRGSIFPGCHSLWPITERWDQPCARQIAAAAFSMASS